MGKNPFVTAPTPVESVDNESNEMQFLVDIKWGDRKMLEALTVIASLASIASLAIQLGVPVLADGSIDFRAVIDRIRSRLSPDEQKALDTPGAEKVISLLIIDEELLRDLKGAAERCLSAYRAQLKHGADRRYREKADRDAERCVCENLNRIKQRNDGLLPGEGPWERWWKSYRCIDDFNY